MKFTHQVVLQIVKTKESESKTLEFKETLPTLEKNEFLKDITAMANAAGGTILFGIREEKSEDNKKTGRAGEITPFEPHLIEEAKQRLGSWCMFGITPRIQGLEIYPLEVVENKYVMAIDIPKSHASPHMVKDTQKFYVRTDSGCHQMDVEEIRNAFIVGANLQDKIRNFRIDRVAKIKSGDTPVQLRSGESILVFHLLPFSAFSGAPLIDVSTTEPFDELKPNDTGWDTRHNLDGFVKYGVESNGAHRSYVQVFRSGCIEFVTTNTASINNETYSAISTARFVKERLEAGSTPRTGARLLTC